VSLVVSDSGPIHYLVLCGAIETLPKLYNQLIIPGAVFKELTHANTPPEVKGWIQSLPAWASIKSPVSIDSAMRLGSGEREAISLALELHATQVLIDDRLARRIAMERGLLVGSTIGILEQAAAIGLLDLPVVMKKLLNTNFRIDVQVVRDVLERDAARRGDSGTG